MVLVLVLVLVLFLLLFLADDRRELVKVAGKHELDAVVARPNGGSDVGAVALHHGLDALRFGDRRRRGLERRVGTEHEELYVTAQDGLDVVPRLPDMFDEPFADSSQIPTFLVSKMARRHVTVAVYDLLGREVERLVDGETEPGTYELRWDAASRPSGDRKSVV